MSVASSRLARGTAVLAGAALLAGLGVSTPAFAAPGTTPKPTVTAAPDRRETTTEHRNACAVRTLITTTFADPDSTSSQGLAARLVSPSAVAHGAGTTAGPTGLLAQFTADRARIPGAHAVIKRIAADGDLVAVHWQITPDPRDERRGDAAVDLFRLEHGRIVERWSLEQPVPTGTPSSGNTNTMFSDLYRPARPTAAPSEHQEERNRVLAVSAYDTLFRDHDPSILDRAFDPAYLQHNPVAPNGTAALKQLFGSGAQFPAQQSVISLSDGDIVWTFSQAVGAKPGDPLLAADLFRVDDGLIREHWDVVPRS
jgi:predicted SnoaL-like aldol condensation-catalyzing enzyme